VISGDHLTRGLLCTCVPFAVPAVPKDISVRSAPSGGNAGDSRKVGEKNQLEKSIGVAAAAVVTKED